VKNTYIIICWFLYCASLNRIGNETQDCSNPKEESKTTKQVLAKLDPFWCLLRGCKGVGTISLEELLSPSVCMALKSYHKFNYDFSTIN
jgi:hypothetical protein